jgi:gluconolactonase
MNVSSFPRGSVQSMFLSVALLHFSVTSPAVRAADPIAGIGPVGPVTRLHTELKFTEGPASDADGNLYFTDIPANRIYKVDGAGGLSVALEPSRHANGLMFDGAGRLVACEMDGALVVRDLASGLRHVLADRHDGKRFNAPNDLVIDRHGGVYFTDPRFRAPKPWPQGKEAFYYRSAQGHVTRLGSDLAAPNGVILAPDEKSLYVIPSAQKEMMVYPVEGPGVIGRGRVFCRLEQPPGTDSGGGDGLTIDTQGNLYIASALGIQVFNPRGDLLGTIELPEQPANVTFGGPGRQTLYVTARTSLYRLPMEAVGHVFPGRVK